MDKHETPPGGAGYIPISRAVSGEIKRCVEGAWAEMKARCNAFPPSIIGNPGWFAAIYSDETPKVGLAAAPVGQPEE